MNHRYTAATLTQSLLLVVTACGLAACTPDSLNSEEARAAAALTTKVSTVQAGCSAEDLAAFDQTEGEAIDADRDALPRGFFLATSTEVFLEKKADGAPVRLRVREVPGGKMSREIVCSENTDRLESDFEMAITGLVKFDTSMPETGVSYTSRQFHIFSDKNEDKSGYGVVVSTPTISARAGSLKQAFPGSSIGQLFRLDERNYLLKFYRERESYRLQMIVRLEFIPQN